MEATLLIILLLCCGVISAVRSPTEEPTSGEAPVASTTQPPTTGVYNGDTSWMNVGDCGEGLTCNSTCQKLCLKLHNYYRALHNSPPLKCDPQLAKSAQEWTDEQAAAGYMHYSKWTDKFTESISRKGWGREGMDKMEGAIPEAVRSWYSEIKNNYNYQTGTGSGVIGHFQAVVWKGETGLGCGLNIKPDDGTYVTAHYAPASHASIDKEEEAQNNVKPRKQPVHEETTIPFDFPHEQPAFPCKGKALLTVTAEPACDIRSTERVACFGKSAPDAQKVPYVTPELCIQAGCCYDDMYMSEPDVWYYSEASGRTWCFKKKEGGRK